MGAALNIAASSHAYVLTDRGTWLSLKNRGDLGLVVKCDAKLFYAPSRLRLCAGWTLSAAAVEALPMPAIAFSAWSAPATLNLIATSNAMLYALSLLFFAALALAALGLPQVRALLFWLAAVPVLWLGAWWLWQMEGIGWWALAALAVSIPAAWYDARNAARR